MGYCGWHSNKQLITTNQAKAVEELYSQHLKFSHHLHDARRQHYEMRQIKADLTLGKIILHRILVRTMSSNVRMRSRQLIGAQRV